MISTAIIGTGAIAEVHARALSDAAGVKLLAVQGRDAQKASLFAEKHAVHSYSNLPDLLRSETPDYLTLCTPHPSHAALALEGLRYGVHVFIEKPFTVTANEAKACLTAAAEAKKLIGVNFQMRLKPVRQKMREIVQSGTLGRPLRVSLISTAWFRTMAYYRSSPWRATWEGEGGGVLMNQAPHDLDLLIELLGLPAFVDINLETAGHAIEVEDDVTGVLQWENGATGTIHLSTRESPGRSFLEIAGTRGTLTLAEEALTLSLLSGDSSEWIDQSADPLQGPQNHSRTSWTLADSENRYKLMHENFAQAILGKAPLHCGGADALRQVQLANAMLLSGLKRQRISLPIDSHEVDTAYARLIQTRSLH